MDSASGAAVRIAMTVAAAGQGEGRLATVVAETPGEHGEMRIEVTERTGLIHADLTVGPNLTSAKTLRASADLSSPGMKLHGAGFIVTPEQAASLLPTPALPTRGEGAGQGGRSADLSPARGEGWEAGIIRPYRNGRDLTDTSRGVLVIDLFGLTAEQVRSRYPAVYQWLIERVKPERDQNQRASYRDNWWIFGEPRRELRKALAGLPRYIVTVETAKHRTFQFLDAAILPDNMLVVIASDDAYHLGVLSSSVHVAWALAQGGTLEDRPRHNKTRCFETFPFPDADTGMTPELRQRIAACAEAIDAHRKRVLDQHPDTLTLTGLYNVLAALRAGHALSPKERTIHTHGLVAVLRELHDELDAAVLAAYGWADLAAPHPSAADDRNTALLERLLALNHARAAEEAAGTVRWLRPALQNPQAALPAPAALDIDTATRPPQPAAAPAAEASAQPWPATLPEQMRAVADLLAASAQPLAEDAIAAHFKGRGLWKKSLPRILDTLAALGRARREAAGWRG
ncbi:MAG: type IIL restriction-modification enzyme MmeI [Thiomonas sp.]